jgi:ADP-ribose pyrophosphatase YjhB (NUDIX family)
MDTQAKIGVVISNNAGDQIILIKEKTEKHEKPLWNVIKGSYGDKGDENIFEAAQRECREEASVKVELVNALGAYISKDKDRMRIQFNFLAKVIEGEPKVAPADEQQPRDENIQEIKWFTREEISNLNQEEFISNRIYELVQDWISGKKYPLEVYKQVPFGISNN